MAWPIFAVRIIKYGAITFGNMPQNDTCIAEAERVLRLRKESLECESVRADNARCIWNKRQRNRKDNAAEIGAEYGDDRECHDDDRKCNEDIHETLQDQVDLTAKIGKLG